jgi:Fe-S-cluster-containing hydrogenase components 1
MSRLSLLVDVTKCSGCHNCFLACRDEHFGNDYLPYSAAQPLNGQFWMQIREIERGAYPRPKLSYIPTPCMHCEEAPCEEVAKDGAVYRREDGIVVIDPEKARGQEQIVSACPYRVIFWNSDLNLPQKCTLCAHRLDEGEIQPRCVESCPTGALVFGDLDDPDAEIAKLSAALPIEAFHPEYDTAPLVRYVGIPKRLVAGEVVLEGKEDTCAEGVKITLSGEGVRMETASDAFGDFEFEGLAQNGAYRMTIAHAGYAPRQIEVRTQTDVDLAEIVLTAS